MTPQVFEYPGWQYVPDTINHKVKYNYYFKEQPYKEYFKNNPGSKSVMLVCFCPQCSPSCMYSV